MKKIPIEREKSDVRISSSEREEARPKVKIQMMMEYPPSKDDPVALAPACSLDDDVSVAPLLHYCAAWPFNCQNFLWYYHIVSIVRYIVTNPI